MGGGVFGFGCFGFPPSRGTTGGGGGIFSGVCGARVTTFQNILNIKIEHEVKDINEIKADVKINNINGKMKAGDKNKTSNE